MSDETKKSFKTLIIDSDWHDLSW